MTPRKMTIAHEGIISYYGARVGEYEDIYEKPERQLDLKCLTAFLSKAFTGKDVLEVACGTGYWTEIVARSARSIIATDISREALEVARKKQYGKCRMTFLESDAYSLSGVPSYCSAGFHAFWWSHIPLQDIARFLACFHGRLKDRSLIIMVDNRFVEGSSTPISRTDEQGNTYQIRELKDGSRQEVLKNFPSSEDIRTRLHDVSMLRMAQLQYYWMADYRKKRVLNNALNRT